MKKRILSWLLAVLIEYLILPGELRDLAKLDGLPQMSMIRIIGVAVGIAVLLGGLSRFARTKVAERWGIAAVSVLLAIEVVRPDGRAVE